MYLVTHALILLFGIYFCNAGYGIPALSGSQQTQSDVQAPAYVPSYLKNQRFSKTGYSRGPGLKTGYSGTKTGYTGTKTGYTGTKTGYTGTKTGTKTSYAGTKTAGTKTAYAGTKNVQPSKTGYSQSKTWSSSYGAAPSYQEFHSKANEAYTAKCEPDCKNNGICVDTNTCHCPVNYYGKYCEFEKKPCLTYPPLPMNSRRKCSSDLCTITCMEGHKFIDGSTVANMRCVDGQWQPTRADFSSIPDCEPECNPPCANGGVCLALNTCQCPADYRGPQCQYAATVCDVRKLAFNGGYNCFGDSEKFSCKLNCPSGSTYSSAPAEVYTCLYSAGQFEPQPIPHCVFNEVVVITPSNGHSEYSSSSQFYETHYENHTSESYGFGYENESSSGRGDIDIELLGGSDHRKSGHGQGHADTEYDQSQIHAGFGQSQTEYGEPTYGHKNYGGNEKPVKIVVQDFTPKGGTCLSWAGVHYKTFDGKIYSFQSSCQHILVRDAKEHKYTVAIRQGDCKRQSYCPTELTIYLEDKPYVLSVGEDGSVVFRSTKRLIPIPASLPGIRVAMPSDYVVVNLDALGVTIKWDTNNLVLIEGTLLLWNNTEGLCGRLDGNPVNDLTTKEGKIAKTKSVLASSWQLNKIGDICDSNPTETSACASKSDEDMKKALQFCTKIFSKDKFRKCSKAMDVSLLLEACQWDYCACTTSLSPEECSCSTVSVYAKECLRHGVEEMKNWRDADTCPMKCPEGKLYQSCGPDAQPSCAFPLLSTKADNTTCVEGCFCPEGLLLEGGRCIPKENCPCRLRNKSFPPGSVVPKDCNTCTCQSGEWTCTQVPCGARCGAVGDPHYTTFDGLRYDFMGHCTYNLLKTDNLTVEVENVACSGAITEAMNLAPYKGSGKPSCTKAVNLIYEGINVHLKQGGFILVNGKEVASLPVHIGDVLIRAASSLFVILQLPNRVDLWWDGNTRVFVDVPPEFAGKTKGLCGTFNLNQKDDFLTPEGDVEQSALAFANKWKTREFCDDVETKEPEHPCKANVENKETAEKYCTKLKSKLFEACHWHVDVEPYYEECVYDMCACAGDAARCLCPILGDYAMACAKAGVKIQWRYNVKECELSCSGGQEYTVCADSCQRTCSDVALSATGHCKPVCVEGCACAPGQVLDNSGVCVPIGLCPCYHKGMQFDAGYKEVRAGKRERELCTCVGARWDCKPATPDEVQNYPPAEDMRNNCSTALHMEFTTCEIAEPLTCKNMHLPPSSTTTECRPGCQCKKGYVLDTTSKKCVLATQCPCHHGGRSYPDGYVMQEECNKCECKSGNWTCSQRKCAGVCGAWGDSHITTFDGADYDFEGVCTYLLAKGVLDANDGFDVEIQNVPCGTTGATCSKSLTLKVGTGSNEEIVSLTKNAPIPDLSKLKRIKLRIAGSYVFLDVPSLGMSVQWDRGMRVYVKVDAMWQNRVKGLCGNYNADLRDDFQTPSGGGIAETSALLFADSWKLKPTCPKPQPVRDHCQQRPERKEWATSACGALKRYPFTLCHTEVPPTAFIERCEKDACACDSGEDCECACTALAAYAQRCSTRGVVFKWRTQERCPMQCDEECSNYDACVSACPLETCDNIHYYEETRPLCEHDTCVEGCKPKKSCPEGSVYNNRSYTECVPIAKCKPVCLTLPDGREVLEGEVIEEDACHTCRCSKKQKICTGIPCTSSAPLKSSEATTVTPKPEKPHDEPLKCVTGWTNWISRDSPTPELNAESVDNEPLPKINELPIGSPTCKQEKIKKIECRTIIGHKTPKETGLNVECSLERGLICRESGANVCPDFEIRVYCECEEEPFQCLNSDHPNYPHPTDCSKFYECTPDVENPSKPHTVLKSCAEGLMYNPTLMICDWPAAVIATRPECGNRTEEITKTETPIPESTVTSATVTLPSTVTPIVPEACPPGQVYSDCAYPCDKLCDHFKRTLQYKGKCFVGLGDKCVKGCVNKTVAETDCSKGKWRDETTCVPEKDCTCYDKGNIVKPGGVVIDGCVKCQCLDNDLHCDVSECETTFSPIRTPSHSTEPPIFIVSTEQAHTPSFSPPILLSVTPPPECSPDNYINLLESVPDTAFSASSVAGPLFEPPYASLHRPSKNITGGSWNPSVTDQNQYIQVELPRKEPIYGVVTEGNPIFNEYVSSYEIMYGDDGSSYTTVNEPDGKPKVFKGPESHKIPSKQMIEPPILARFIRLRPLTWHEGIAVQFELIGCQEPLSTNVTTVKTTTTIQTPTPSTVAPIIVKSTVSPPPECNPDSYINLLENREIPDVAYSASSVAGPLFLPPYASLHRPSKNLTGGTWNPTTFDQNQYIQVELPQREPIYGVVVEGSPVFDEYVTSYEIMYGDDGNIFSTVNGPDGTPKVFRGPADNKVPVKQMIEPPIEARYVRLHPLTWHEGIAVQFELIGCQEPLSTITTETTLTTESLQCTEPLGLAAELPVESIEVSSNNDARQYFALDSARGWRPAYSTPGEWIMFDFQSPRNITGIKTKGGPKGWVTSYNIMYTSDLSTFNPVVDSAGKRVVFPGNFDRDSVVTNEFHPPIHARYFKVLPLKWQDNIEMRVEPIGCFEPYSITTNTPSPTKGVPKTEEPMQCTEPLGLAADLPVESIEVSSNNDARQYFALNGARGWRPAYSTPGEWIMFDFQSPRNITGIKTKGGPNGWVTSYNIMYTSDLKTFTPVVDNAGKRVVFPGNSDRDSVVTNEFHPPINARYFKVLPLKWKDNIEMRVEPIGCFEPYSATTPTPSPAKGTSATEEPMQCTEPLGLAADLPVESIEVSSNNDARQYFALDSARGWRPTYSTPGEWIMFDFQTPRNITGIKTKGGPKGWVTSYNIMYTSDLSTFNPVVDSAGKRVVFPGNFDRDSVVTNEFHPPIHARYFKVLPLKWQDNIEMRVEPIGCFEPYSTTPSPTKGTTPTTKEPMQCTEPLGLAAELPVESIEVSSNNDARQYFALEGARGWRPAHSTPGEWIMFDFQSPRNITGIKIKGGPKGWVTSYNIMYTSDLNTFNPVVDSVGKQVVFPGNFDHDSVVTNEFHPPIHARYFKVLPLKWKDNIEMRVEPIGCFEPYSVTERTPTVLLEDWIGTKSTVTPCKPCPGIRASGCMCATPEAPYFDGENCVPRDQCPCVESFMTYAVGSTFRGSECDECVCKLGGVTICKPVKECKCAPNLVPKLVSSSCECFCEPCPPGTKICPTSKLCLPLEKWCDGLQDCPDDERECSTAITPTVITTVTIEPTFVTKAPPTAGSQVTVGTTVKPLECPKAECPPGYMIRYTTTSSSSYSRSSTSDLPPPRPRVSYQRYRNGGAAKGGRYAKGGYSKTGYSKTGYSKGGYSKGGYSGAPTQPQSNQAFSLDKPSINNNMHTIETKQECAQFKCIPKLPPIPRPGSTPAPVVCSAPTCPPQYSLKLESVPTEANKCPQYVCVPPPERPVFCNVTGRTINTFDGTEYKYDVCFHILARENRFDAWTVLVRKKCRVDGCQNELLVRQDDQLILVKPNLMIEYDNYEYNVEQTSMICFQKNSFDIGRLGNGLAIKSRKYNFTVLYTTDGDIKIGVSKSLMGTVDGLCGAFDGVPSNDRRRPDGVLAASIDEFGRSWAKPGLPPDACRTKVIDAQKQKRVWDLCDAITKEPISQCAKVLNLDKWRSICLEKICECADLVVNGTKRTEEECRCLLVEKLVAECLAADKDLDVASWRMQLDCPAECPPPLVHYDCYRKRCEPTCGGSGAARSCPADEGHCFPGCYCPEGKLRKGDLCVAPPDCLDCVCNGVGTPSKFVTFERDDLPYGGNCTYLASRDRNETGQHKYEVYITNGPCAGNNGIVCTNIVHLIYEKNVIHITKDPITKKLQTTISDSPVFKYPLKKDWVIISLVNGQDISIVLPDVHVELTVQQSKMDFAVRVPSHLYANQTEGLCGVCAGYQEHLVTSNGTITDDIEQYGKSWQATPEALTTLDVPPQEQCDEIPPEEEECIPPQADQNPCYNLYNEEKFGACHPLVDPEEYVHMCEEELCALNSSDVCDVLERYAAECRQEGVCLDWRSDLCPHPCAEPLVYRPCVDCERTCDNDEELKKNPKNCDKKPVEGCFCPEGKVRVNNTCIEPTKCFPCDAKKEHYAGDEWQEDACTKCSCSKLSEENRAHVSCTTQTCSAPVCSEEEDTIAKPKRPGACCTEYICVPKPQDNPQCDEPKKMECGFGQVLKQKTKANGCKEFACECKPASECEHIPTESEVDILEPGMERLVDNSGCCPRVQLLCRKETCPGEPECPRFHVLETKNNIGKCCPEYSCELPKDKCVVTLEWEAASKGGEKSRKNPQVMLKDLDSAWLDGPCRSCRCEASPLGAVPRCSVTECNPVTSTEQFVLEPRPVPFACCPRPVQVACRDGDNIYKVGENWTSPYDVCESYECVEVGDGKLERITTLQTCHEDCQPGWKYFPADRNTKQCCGKCRPVACVVNGEEHKIGDRWTSPDHCTNYTCVDLDGTLQVQSSDEVCSEPSTALKKQFVLKENKVPGVCCSTHEPVACRVGNKVYQEGQTWPSPDPCRNVTCARDDTGRLTKTESVETCVKECKRGWKYVEAEAGVCCGHCVQDACVVDDELRKPGTTWQSADNCTTYSCEGSADGVYVTSARESCPDISACKPEDIVNDTCCQICVEKPSSLSTCVPERVENAEVVGLIRIRLGAHGVCVNKQPLNQLKECRGTCGSGTVYNNRTGSHDSNCECCQAVKYEPIVVELSCDDGTLQQHRVASPAQCKCQKCGGGSTWPTKTGYSGTKNPPRKGGYAEYEIPSMYARFGESTEIPTR